MFVIYGSVQLIKEIFNDKNPRAPPMHRIQVFSDYMEHNVIVQNREKGSSDPPFCPGKCLPLSVIDTD